LTGEIVRRVIEIALICAAILASIAVVRMAMHAPPVPMATAFGQAELIAKLETESGITLPPGVKVLAATDEGSRSGRYFCWVIFREGSLNLPGSLLLAGDVYAPRLNESVRDIEQKIAPFKIESPSAVMDHAWAHRGIYLQAIVVAGAKGSYALIDTTQQD
jgi:hypothetical protein